MIKNYHSRMIAFLLAVCLLATLSGCSDLPDYSIYESLPGSEYLGWLTLTREQIAKKFPLTDDTWEWLIVGDMPGPRPNLREPVEILDGFYTLYFRFSMDGEQPDYLFNFFLEQDVTDLSPEDRNQAVANLYDLLVSELGEPADPHPRVQVNSIPDGLEKGFSTTLHRARWLLAEQVPLKCREIGDSNLLLLLSLEMERLMGSWLIRLDYRVMDSGYSDLADYPMRAWWFE